MSEVTIYTDGACSGNPGPGGWGVVLTYNDHRKELSGGNPQTTNNRMELQAAIEALRALRRPASVELFTDSTYVKNGITQWIDNWKKNGWKRKRGRGFAPIKNEDLWRELDRLVSRHSISFHWVEGHAGDPENERCDKLARNAILKIEN